jgi:hypothetical protein
MSQMAPSEWSSGLQAWLAAEGVSEALLKANLKLTPIERLNRFLESYRLAASARSRNFSPPSPVPAEFDPLRLFGALESHQVEFVIIGGMAAVLHGSFLITWDLDVLCLDTSDNRSRVVETFGVDTRSPQTAGRLGFVTELGAVDCLFDSTRYWPVSARKHAVSLGDQIVPVASLDDLIDARASPLSQDVRLWELVELRELVASP